MRAVLALIACSLLVIARAPEADACSCPHEAPVISPANGKIDVPLNAMVIVRFPFRLDYFTVELREADTNTVVPLTSQVDSGLAYFATPGALQPSTRYQITVSSGQSEPTTSAIFTTGNTSDLVPPEFAGLTAFVPETMEYPFSGCYSSCINSVDGHLSRIKLDFGAVPSDAVHIALQLVRRGTQAVDEIPLRTNTTKQFAPGGCGSTSPTLMPGAAYCARLVVYDIAGNRAGLDTELCTPSQICAGYGTPDSPLCEPSNECLESAPPDGIIVNPPGSSGCAATHPSALIALALLGLRRRRARSRR